MLTLPDTVTSSSVTAATSATWPLLTLMSPPPLTVAFSISLEALINSVPVSSMVPPSMVAPLSVTVSSIVNVEALLTLPDTVTSSNVTASTVRTWPLLTLMSPPPLTVAFSISLEALINSVPVSSMVPPSMVAPLSVTVSSIVSVRRCSSCPIPYVVQRHRIHGQRPGRCSP